ncbi:MAG: DUF5668 domain-containing protein [Thermoanaerobaculales bacterium]|jgi:hypothetical protein|nr:DUF5668 domain-containing protein [Thermoanaerobaculales bacterium]
MTDPRPPLPPDELDDPVSEPAPAPARPAPPLPPVDTLAAPPAAAPPAPSTAPSVYMLEKSPGLALFLSIFFPGLGHIYVGAYERALMIIGGIAASIWGMVATDGELWPLAFAIAFAYFFGLFDAYREAQIANLGSGQQLPEPRPRGEGRLIFGIFLTVVAALVLADNLGLFDLDWIDEWWPALVLLVGVYFIGSWVWDRMNPPRDAGESSYD